MNNKMRKLCKDDVIAEIDDATNASYMRGNSRHLMRVATQIIIVFLPSTLSFFHFFISLLLFAKNNNSNGESISVVAGCTDQFE